MLGNIPRWCLVIGHTAVQWVPTSLEMSGFPVTILFSHGSAEKPAAVCICMAKNPLGNFENSYEDIFRLKFRRV